MYSGTDEELSYQWDQRNVERLGRRAERAIPGGEELIRSAALITTTKSFSCIRTPVRWPGLTRFPPIADFDASLGLQEVALVDPLNPNAQKFVYLGMKKAGTSPQFAGQSVYVSYSRDANADQWIDGRSFCDNDPEKLSASNTGYGPNRRGKVYVNGANCQTTPGPT